MADEYQRKHNVKLPPRNKGSKEKGFKTKETDLKLEIKPFMPEETEEIKVNTNSQEP